MILHGVVGIPIRWLPGVEGSTFFNLEVRIEQLGADTLVVTFSAKWGSDAVWETQVDLRGGARILVEEELLRRGCYRHPEHHRHQLQAGQGRLDELIALLARDMKRERGVWTPKWKPGDALILDRPGSDEFKVIDPETQTAERIEKHSIEVKDDRCTCPMRALLMKGCPRSRGGDKCFTDGEQ